MGGKDFIAVLVLAFLSLWLAVYLETGLESYFVLELFVILLLIILSTGIFYGIVSGKKWAWHALSFFFLAVLINCTLVYIATSNKPIFFFASFINLAGFIVGASRAIRTRGVDNQNNKQSQIEMPPKPDKYEVEDYLNILETFEFEPEVLELKEEEAKTTKKRAKTAGKRKKTKPKARKKR